jgi:catechol 2,3-dioxygenase-like lactoylglutathione lyase family enzyme
VGDLREGIAKPPLSLLQITLIVRDLEAAIRDFEAALGLRVAFRDPGVALWGLENAVLPMGRTFIELLSPTRADTPGGRHLARQGGDGGYMVILQTDDLDAWRDHLGRIGVRIAWHGETRDEAHDLAWAGLHLHPRDTGGMMISFDRPDPPESWAGAGPHWRDHVVQDVVDELIGIELRSPDPLRLAERWAEVLGRPVEAEGQIDLDRGMLGFAPGGEGPDAPERSPEGLARVSLRATDRKREGERIPLAGVEFVLV